MNKEVFEFLTQFAPLNVEIETRLNMILKTHTFKKKDFLLRAGEVCNNIYYIEKGLVRVFYTDEEGEQWCSGLLSEGGAQYNTIGRKLITEYYVRSEERNFWLRKHSAEKKYQFFKEKFGESAGRFPIKDIASYLGIKIETLSRLRGKF